jgi:hypothetical protein
MLDPLDLRGRVVMEPSAGSGNLVSECLTRGAAEVLCCEPESKLRAILAAIPSSRLLGNDWLAVTAEQISHVDLIAMNPPFSADERHILHAWEIAPPGAEIVALCNWSTISGHYRGMQLQLAKLIEAYGSSENLGECFADSERPTRVSVGMVRLTKPGSRPDADEFDGFFLGPDDIEAQGEGLIPYRRSRDIVNRYVEACRIFDEQVAAGVRLQSVLDGFFGKDLGLQVYRSRHGSMSSMSFCRSRWPPASSLRTSIVLWRSNRRFRSRSGIFTGCCRSSPALRSSGLIGQWRRLLIRSLAIQLRTATGWKAG